MKIYRKRYIPNEVVDISSDKIIYCDENVLVTTWIPIRVREDKMAHGKSIYYFNEGWKISQILDKDYNLLYYYCDIIDTKKTEDGYLFTDLLVDIIYKNGGYLVLDSDELEQALERNLIDRKIYDDALTKLHALEEVIKKGDFPLDDFKKYN